MRNKFTLNEGEVQRILGLHKKAINENLNIFSTNKTVLLEEINYSQKFKQSFERIKSPQKKGETQIKSFYLPEKTKWKETKDGAKANVTDQDKTPVFFKCVGYNNFDFLVDEAESGKYAWFKSKKLGSILRGKFCNNKNADEGSSNLGVDYKQTRQQNFLPLPGKGKVEFSIPADNIWKKAGDKGAITKKPGWNNIGFLCAGYLSPKNVAYNFMYDKTWYRNKAFGDFLKPKFCGTKTETNNDGKKVDGTSELDTKDKSNKDTKDKSNNNTKVKGNKYTFDFDAIMKAINDTGKCAGYSGSSDGTNGTNGTQGTNGIQNPVPINNKISAELYYKITAS